MHGKPIGRFCCLAVALTYLGSAAGCSDDVIKPIDTGATIKKASGGDGTARLSAKSKAASEEAAKAHPKLH